MIAGGRPVGHQSRARPSWRRFPLERMFPFERGRGGDVSFGSCAAERRSHGGGYEGEATFLSHKNGVSSLFFLLGERVRALLQDN